MASIPETEAGMIAGGEAMPAEDAQALIDAKNQEQIEKQTRLAALVAELEKKCDEVVKARKPIESRWIDDQRQYDGQRPRTLESKRESTSSEDNASPPYVHHTRSRTNMATSRITDMLFPANDQAWDIGPTESPRLSNQTNEDGTPMTMAQVRSLATEAAERMKDEIQDQLTESRFPEHGRAMIADACRLGIGVLKGPYIASRPENRFKTMDDGEGGTVTVMEASYHSTAAVSRVNPWNFFPDMAARIDEAEFVFELHLLGRKEILNLQNTPGFDRKAIRAVLKMEADLGEVGRCIHTRNSSMDLIEPTSDRWAVWEYHGPLNKDELIALDLDIDDDIEILPNVEVWFCQGKVLMAKVELFESDLRLPYYVYPYQQADDTMFGHGVPYLLRDSDRAIQAGWEIALVNSAVSSGPQTIYKDGKVTPADGSYRIRGPKLWRANSDYDGPLSEVFYSHIIPNNAEQALAMFDRAIQLADDEIGLPEIAQGNPSSAVPTYGGLLTLMNASNIVQRRAAITFDDNIIVPMIERMYWWNMVYNDREDIKGDYQVSARGTSVLLFKDIQNQHLQVFTTMAADPRFAAYVDNYELLKANSSTLDVDASAFIRPREEVEGQEPQPDPAVLAEQEKIALEREKLDVEREKIKADREVKLAQLDFEHANAVEEQNTRRMEAQAKAIAAESTLQARMAEIASTEGLSLAQLRAKYDIAERGEETKRVIAGMNARVHAREMALKVDPRNASGLGI